VIYDAALDDLLTRTWEGARISPAEALRKGSQTRWAFETAITLLRTRKL